MKYFDVIGGVMVQVPHGKWVMRHEVGDAVVEPNVDKKLSSIRLPIMIISGRVLLDWGKETETQQACVHGVKLRWVCDNCNEIINKKDK